MAVRRVLAVVLLAAAVLLAPVAAASAWLRAEVLDTDAYVATTSAVLADPEVRDAVGDAVGDLAAQRVLDRLDDSGLTGLARGPVERLVRGYARDATATVLGSDAVAAGWATAQRTVHAELMALAHEDGDRLRLDRDSAELLLPVGPVLSAVQSRLALDGLPDLGAATDTEVVLLRGDAVVQAVDAVRLLDTLGRWLPVGTVLAGLLGVLLVPGGGIGGSGRRGAAGALLGGRLRALGWAGVALAAWSAAVGLVVRALAGRAPDLVADAGAAEGWGDLGSAVVGALLDAWGGGLSGLLVGTALGGLMLVGVAWAGRAVVGLPLRRSPR
jgi:hypothetical protein